jgi:ArsR family transcriptional regulator, arsenate/arsenite/antimonite-responsive transcriptional repressor / arsenate reductase (thioredoxin)
MNVVSNPKTRYSGNMEISDASQIFAALGQESRLGALRLLLAQNPEGVAAGELAGKLSMPPSTTSFHLSALEKAGLVENVRQGRQVIYSVRTDALRDLLAFLTEACCGGQPELCADLVSLLPTLPQKTEGVQPAFNVLFLCTRNSARSIMAEAILATFGRGRFRAYSAGSDPADRPMPEVVEKLRAVGHDVSGLHAKSWERFIGPDAPRMDFVIALCDTLDGQECPDFGEASLTAKWGMPDPAKFSGSTVERSTMLNELYASLYRRIVTFTNLPFAKLERMALKARLDEIGEGPIAALMRWRKT